MSVRVMRTKRSTEAGIALFEGDDLAAEFTRRLYTRNEWVGWKVNVANASPSRTGEGRLTHVDRIAVFHRAPGKTGDSGKGHWFRFDALTIEGVPGMKGSASASEGSDADVEASADTAPAESMLLTAAPIPEGPPEPRRGNADVSEILRNDPLVDEPGFKYRIMVDKVNIGFKESVAEAIEAGDFRKYAELGFNVLSPRKHSRSSIEEIARAAERCGELGMYHMHWQRASYPKRRDRSAPVFVHSDGLEYSTIHPASEAFWDLLEADVMPVVRLSTRHPILGVFFDFEKYDKPRLPDGTRAAFIGHWYGPSFDDHAWAMFFESRGESVPSLAAGERADWLDARGMRSAYRAYQVDYWREKARALRQKVDEINPRFRFAVYPSSFTLFINQVVWKELATEEAPIIAAEHYTYGRGNPLKDTAIPHWRIPDDQALKLDHAYLLKMRNKYRGRKNHVILGGLDPQVLDGSDAMLNARKAELYGEHFDGYWVFYEGVIAGSHQERTFDAWWKLANESITGQRRSVVYDFRERHPHLAHEWLDKLNADLP